MVLLICRKMIINNEKMTVKTQLQQLFLKLLTASMPLTIICSIIAGEFSTELHQLYVVVRRFRNTLLFTGVIKTIFCVGIFCIITELITIFFCTKAGMEIPCK